MAKKSRFRQLDGYSEELKSRTEEVTGGNYITVFKKGSNLPFWKDKEGDHAIDIIPWVSSSNHPNYPKNKGVYKVELWVHKRVGLEKGDYICLRNYGEDCPLCEARNTELAKDNPRQKVADSLKGSKRCYYNVVVYTDNQEDKGVQIWEASTYLAEDPFKETAKNKRTGERLPFADPDRGKTVTFTVSGKQTSKKISGIVFEDRPDVISEDILDEAFIIEDYLEKPDTETLETIAKIILGGAVDSEDEEPDPPKRRRSRPAEDEEPEEEAPVKKKKRPVEDEPEDEPIEEDSPAPRRKRPVEEEPEEEDEPAPRRKRPVAEEEDEPAPRRKRPAEDEPEEEPVPRRKRPVADEEEPEESTPPPTRRMRKRE